ncbi:DUF488 domain-containing protein [Microbulbifer spongiae]|uniref:DUF488 family protein n=1 Tax=Microbulbifer spongiae TaxID=2944933 RepID=A0ABY9EEV5_9GAMM|nr:DUF488 family protein [Microbulbifer sp. MI-G]WKD50054.1 DUF488 family protein [Microbulbifer sp. MI-G]
MKIKIKRVYEEAKEEDGERVLVDRLWPRGLSKGKGKIDKWIKEIAPSNELRKWYGHDPKKWLEFKIRYFDELNKKRALLEQFCAEVSNQSVTLLFSSKELKLNNAVALKEYLESIINVGKSHNK